MKILVQDSVPAVSATLARALGEAIGHETLYASSDVEALSWLQIEKDAIGVVVYFLEDVPEAGLSFIRKVREFCGAAAIRIPRFLVLTPGALRDGYEGRFRAMGAECLLNGFEKQMIATVRRLTFDALCEHGRPTFVLDRSGLYMKFNLVGAARSELIPYGQHLHPMMNCLAINFGTGLSSAMLADAADISLSSVSAYLVRLRAGYDETRVKVGVDIPGREVISTARKDGAYVHTLKARVLFI